MNALQEEDASPMTTAGSTSTDTSHDEESDDIRDAQLNDDVLSSILRLKETNQQPEETTLARMGHEARQLHQQWPQLIVQDGVLYQKVETKTDMIFTSNSLSLDHEKSLSYRRHIVVA